MTADELLAEMVFDDPAPKSVPVKIGGVPHRLKEPSEAAYAAFQAANMRGARAEANGMFTPGEGMAEAQAILVAGCVVAVDLQGNEAPVPLAVVKSWPSRRVVQPLFERAKLLGGIGLKEGAEARPLPASPGSGPGGSASPGTSGNTSTS